jgi:hypothetical protein
MLVIAYRDLCALQAKYFVIRHDVRVFAFCGAPAISYTLGFKALGRDIRVLITNLFAKTSVPSDTYISNSWRFSFT